jgi:hypothetical protein
MDGGTRRDRAHLRGARPLSGCHVGLAFSFGSHKVAYVVHGHTSAEHSVITPRHGQA